MISSASSRYVRPCVPPFMAILTRTLVAHLSTTQCPRLPRCRRERCAVAKQGADAVGPDHAMGPYAHGV